MSDIVSWIWFASRRGIRASLRYALLAHIGTPGEIFKASEAAIQECGAAPEELKELLDRDTATSERIIARCEEENIEIITLQDAHYPERLRNLPDPPAVLYVKGRLPAVDCEAAVAVVGTRSSTPYGEQMARNIGFGIAKCGGVVVTGLAAGIDSMAAKGALMAEGRVIGVLGTAINTVFPRFNKPLFDDVALRGALVSEYPPDCEGNRSFFPARNRIIAGLSVATVVAEAPMGSGALITAHRALDYGREVFAVPGNADAASSRGANELIREGARVCLNAWDVLRDFEPLFPGKISKSGKLSVPAERYVSEEARVPEKPRAKVKFRAKEESRSEDAAPTLAGQLEHLSATQLKIVSAMTKPSMHIDDIIDLSQLPASTVLAELTLLQIKGAVAQESGKRFTLKITKRG